MFSYKLEAHDGMEWRSLPSPISEGEAVRQYQALICNNVPARLTALSAHPMSRQDRTMEYLLNVIDGFDRVEPERVRPDGPETAFGGLIGQQPY